VSNLMLLTVPAAVAVVLVAAAGIYAAVLFRRETRRAQFGRAQLPADEPHRRATS
jgi:hypothetical protein